MRSSYRVIEAYALIGTLLNLQCGGTQVPWMMKHVQFPAQSHLHMANWHDPAKHSFMPKINSIYRVVGEVEMEMSTPNRRNEKPRCMK